MESCRGLLLCDGWELGAEKWSGIPTYFTAEAVGSNAFFVPSEWARCMFVIELINMLIQHGYSDEDVNKLREVMEKKVHYMHLSFEQVQIIDDTRDTQGRRVVSKEVLREGMWLALEFKHKILSAPMNHTNLGLVSTGEPVANQPYHIIPRNDETTFGGSVETGKQEEEFKWTKYPPFRFALEFKHVDKLPGGKRVYSRTIWYAGSYWNVYIQKVRQRKTSVAQMGLYLHRAKQPTVIPDVPSSPQNDTVMSGSTTIRIDSNRIIHFEPDRQSSHHFNNSGNTTATTFVENDFDTIEDDSTNTTFVTSRSVSGTSMTDNSKRSLPVTGEYYDPRPKIATYFEIMMPSFRYRGNTSNNPGLNRTSSSSHGSANALSGVTRFASSPDMFTLSQSWGWKSTTLCGAVDEMTLDEDDNSSKDAATSNTSVPAVVTTTSNKNNEINSSSAKNNNSANAASPAEERSLKFAVLLGNFFLHIKFNC